VLNGEAVCGRSGQNSRGGRCLRPSGRRPVGRIDGGGYCDTDQGGTSPHLTEEPECERYINVAPGRADTLISKTYDLPEQLRRAH
jgi:hypothetical protein